MLDRSFFNRINDAGVAFVAEKLGMELRQHPPSFGPCPSCHSVKRHTKRSDKRLACNIVYEGRGFYCIQCGLKGDAVLLLAVGLNNGIRPRNSTEWRNVRIRALCAAEGWGAITPLPPPEKSLYGAPAASGVWSAPTSRPPTSEVLTLWDRSTPIPPNDEAVEFLKYKFPSYQVEDLLDLDIARWLPRKNLPQWWPWSIHPYLGLIAFDSKGMIQSIHARATVLPSTLGDAPKTRWPKGYSASKLLLANKSAVNWLRGRAEEIPPVIISEGITSTIACSMFLRKKDRWKWANLGVTSGSAVAFKDIEFVAGQDVFIWTDNDKTGDEYCNKIAALLPANILPMRVRL